MMSLSSISRVTLATIILCSLLILQSSLVGVVIAENTSGNVRFQTCSWSVLNDVDTDSNGSLNAQEYEQLLFELAPSTCDIDRAYREGGQLQNIWGIISCLCPDATDLISMGSENCCTQQFTWSQFNNQAMESQICGFVGRSVFGECAKYPMSAAAEQVQSQEQQIIQDQPKQPQQQRVQDSSINTINDGDAVQKERTSQPSDVFTTSLASSTNDLAPSTTNDLASSTNNVLTDDQTFDNQDQHQQEAEVENENGQSNSVIIVAVIFLVVVLVLIGMCICVFVYCHKMRRSNNTTYNKSESLDCHSNDNDRALQNANAKEDRVTKINDVTMAISGHDTVKLEEDETATDTLSSQHYTNDIENPKFNHHNNDIADAEEFEDDYVPPTYKNPHSKPIAAPKVMGEFEDLLEYEKQESTAPAEPVVDRRKAFAQNRKKSLANLIDDEENVQKLENKYKQKRKKKRVISGNDTIKDKKSLSMLHSKVSNSEEFNSSKDSLCSKESVFAWNQFAEDLDKDQALK